MELYTFTLKRRGGEARHLGGSRGDVSSGRDATFQANSMGDETWH
jgi:hypothetical protein